MKVPSQRVLHSSPLLVIQRCEAEVAALIEAADQAAAVRLNDARRQAAALKQRAVDAGRADGRAEYERILAEGRRKADEILEQAERQAEALKLSREQCVESMVNYALEVIFELEKEPNFA